MEGKETWVASASQPRVSWRPIQQGIEGLKEIPARDFFGKFKPANVRASGQWDVCHSPARNSIIVKGRNPGTSLALDFDGEAIGFHLTRHNYSGVLEISADKRDALIVDLSGTWHPDTPMLLVIEGLGPGRHSLALTLVEANDGRNGQEIILVSLFMSKISIEICGLTRLQVGRASELAEPGVTPCIALSAAQDKNIGDRMSQPSQYFSFLRGTPRYDLFTWHPRVNSSFIDRQAFERTLNNHPVIIGGGGLLNTPWFSPALEYIQFAAGKPRILWGVGHNSPDKQNWTSKYDYWDVSAADYTLIGVRDYATRFPWVPCASCMAPEFDKERPAQQELGFFLHATVQKTVEQLRDDWPSVPMMENFGEFSSTIEYLAACDIIVTNSFHGAYWGILLGRRVVAIPTSSKFFSLKHPIPCSDITSWSSAIKQSRRYPEALEECRSSNLAFAAKVRECLGESRPHFDYED